MNIKRVLLRFGGGRCPYLLYNLPRIRVADEDFVMDQNTYDSLITNVVVNEELLNLSKEMAEAYHVGDEKGLSNEKLALMMRWRKIQYMA